MYDSSFHLTKTFTDPTVPLGYAPFGIENIEGNLYVTFALQDDGKHDDVKGPGHGFIDVFATDGTWKSRFAANGVLDSPWGLALAPPSFGKFAHHLLVGNFGDGHINSFDFPSGISEGPLKRHSGTTDDHQRLVGTQVCKRRSLRQKEPPAFHRGHR